jgi:hypothetical protein
MAWPQFPLYGLKMTECVITWMLRAPLPQTSTADVSVNPADHSILTSAPALSELARLRAQPPKVSFEYIFLGVPRYQGDTIRESVEVVRNVFT